METYSSSTDEEEEETPLLDGLFSDERVCSNSSGDDEYSGSDREWRDAVKAAVETEIQYQVQLRLSLDTPIQRKHKRGNTPPANDTAINTNESRLIQLDLEHDLSKPSAVVISPPPLPPPPSQPNDQDDGAAVRYARGKSTTLPGQTEAKDKNEDYKSTAKPVDKPNQPQTVYDYINQKYGVPYSQLRNLMSGGKLECSKIDKSSVGIDERVCWPTECNITKPSPEFAKNHSQTKGTPFFPEALPVVLGQNRPTFNRSKDLNTVIFDRKKNIQTSTAPRDDQGREGGEGLTFESRFESGNLQQAIKVGPNEYDLVLSSDLYTERHTQWFYFQIVAGIQEGVTYVFNIINFRKRNSLYNNGMKLLMYSDIKGSWMRVGENICYRRLPLCNHTPLLKHGTEYYYLSWKMEFPHGSDKCSFAHCYPYTYTNLLKTLDSYEQDTKRKEHIRREELCKTLAGNTCPLLTITDYRSPQEEWSGRMGVVFTARIHPGETNSSWMMDGVLDYLTSEHKHARYLRSKFVFKIIPMLNPDGVIVGNYRTSLSGVDLNRVFKNPIQKIFPTVHATKRLIQDFNEERKIALYVDLHGHSRSYNVFMYGCHANQCNHQQFLEERAVPWMLSQISKEKFSFKKCKFAVQRCKEATGRVSIWREGISNSFTMEASFCGTNLTKPTPLHFTSNDLAAVGRDLCEVLLKIHRYNKSNSYRFKVNSAIAEYLLGTIDNDDNATPLSMLPDLVTSTTNQRAEVARAENERQNHKRKSRQQMAKILQRFHGVSMNALELESSTSGSDSEDDDFTYSSKGSSRSKRNKNKNRIKAHKSSRKHNQATLTNNQQEHKLPKIESSTMNDDQPHSNGGKQLKQTGQHHGSVNSAPPRLQGGGSSLSHIGHGWRFVNRYTNRSNGGIPMFSEERIKERAEKKEKLKSLSQVQNSESIQLPLLSSTSAAAMPLHASASPSAHPPGPPTSTIRPIQRDSASIQLPSLIWKPTDSQRDAPLLATPTSGGGAHLESASVGMFLNDSLQRRRHSETIAISNHYKNIKKLVEDQKKFATFQPRPSRPHVVGMAAAPPSLPPGLPPQLSQYISKIWHKHSDSFF